MKRKKGFYWVKYNPEKGVCNDLWLIAMWEDMFEEWYLPLINEPIDVSKIIEVDERQIVREEPQEGKTAEKILSDKTGIKNLREWGMTNDVLQAMNEYRKQGRYFTEDEIRVIEEDAYDKGYNFGRDSFAQ